MKRTDAGRGLDPGLSPASVSRTEAALSGVAGTVRGESEVRKVLCSERIAEQEAGLLSELHTRGV